MSSANASVPPSPLVRPLCPTCDAPARPAAAGTGYVCEDASHPRPFDHPVLERVVVVTERFHLLEVLGHGPLTVPVRQIFATSLNGRADYRRLHQTEVRGIGSMAQCASCASTDLPPLGLTEAHAWVANIRLTEAAIESFDRASRIDPAIMGWKRLSRKRSP